MRPARHHLYMTVSLPPLRFLDAAAVRAALPPLETQLALAERTLVGLATNAQLPPKISVHPRPAGSFGHAMPAFLPGAAADGGDDLLGMKWITGVPANRGAGLPGLNALVILNDPRTAIPTAILDGGPVTAARTAAISGVAMARWAPPVSGRAIRVGIVGAGAQGHSHVPVIGHVLPGAVLAIHDRAGAFADELAAAAAATPGIAVARVAASAREAVEGADIVLTAVSFGPGGQVMTGDWFAPGALLVAIDYAMSVAAEVARDATLFLTDERGQFEANRAAGAFDGYPDPHAILGEAILAGTPRPAGGRVLVTHLGTGLADLVFADAVLRRAEGAGMGTLLSR